MKRILTAAVAAAFAAMVPMAQAATTDNNFNVAVTLTSVCEATNDSTQTVDFGTYAAFQTTVQSSNSVNLTFRCTRGYAPLSVAFDGGSGVGVLQGLQYTLVAGAPSTVAGTAATTATIGTGDAVTYAVSGTMPADQAGACAAASCGPTSHVRTLTVTY